MTEEAAQAPESASEMHLAAAGDAQRACETCGSTYVPARSWSRFCSTRCRNAFHASEARLEKIRQAGPALYEALRLAREAMRGKDLEHIWINYPTEPSESIGQRIDKVLGSLKPPVEPKALLEKAKA